MGIFCATSLQPAARSKECKEISAVTLKTCFRKQSCSYLRETFIDLNIRSLVAFYADVLWLVATRTPPNVRDLTRKRENCRKNATLSCSFYHVRIASLNFNSPSYHVLCTHWMEIILLILVLPWVILLSRGSPARGNIRSCRTTCTSSSRMVFCIRGSNVITVVPG